MGSVAVSSQKYYIYRHLSLSSGRIFYVGKGCGARANSLANRNSKWHKFAQNGYSVDFLLTGLSESEALAKEKEFILCYRGAGLCEANLTSGGQGVSGFKFSVEQRKKMSLNRLGKKASDETKKRQSVSNMGKTHPNKGGPGKPKTHAHNERVAAANRRAVMDGDGNIFSSVMAAAAFYGAVPTSVTNVLTGHTRSLIGGQTFSYLDRKGG